MKDVGGRVDSYEQRCGVEIAQTSPSLSQDQTISHRDGVTAAGQVERAPEPRDAQRAQRRQQLKRALERREGSALGPGPCVSVDWMFWNQPL